MPKALFLLWFAPTSNGPMPVALFLLRYLHPRQNVGWLVVLCLTALWDSISVYIGPSPKEREKEHVETTLFWHSETAAKYFCGCSYIASKLFQGV